MGHSLDLAVMAAAQVACPDLKEMRTSPSLTIIMQLIGDNRLLGMFPLECLDPSFLPPFELPFVQPCTTFITLVSIVQSMRLDSTVKATYC